MLQDDGGVHEQLEMTIGRWWCTWTVRNDHFKLQDDGGVHEQLEMTTPWEVEMEMVTGVHTSAFLAQYGR